MKRTLLLTGLLLLGLEVTAQTWIWYPGDYEIWLGNRLNCLRTINGAFCPPYWKMDSHYPCVEFTKQFDLQNPDTISIAAEGKYNVKLDHRPLFGIPSILGLPAGKHELQIKVWNEATPPTLYVKGKNVNTDGSWKTAYETLDWVDENGQANGMQAVVYADAGHWNFNSIDKRPSEYKLEQEPQEAISALPYADGILYDFGRETMGYLNLKGIQGNGTIRIYFGESSTEAKDTVPMRNDATEYLTVSDGYISNLATHSIHKQTGTYTMENNRAFRYVYVRHTPSIKIDKISMQYEYLPEDYIGSFKCSDEEVNRIWETSAYTLHLTTRECFIDGIKRDRWTWSGDAIQSYLMNYYLFFDNETVKRTIWTLRGKDPVTTHINAIMDYSFYWFISIYDYYLYTGDKNFIKQIYPRMKTLMDYIQKRTNNHGMMEGQTGDWVFIDWTDSSMDKKGELAFEQILFCRSLEVMAVCAEITGHVSEQKLYTLLASELQSKLEPAFWNEERQALVHNRINGKQNKEITRYANIFAILYNYLNKDKWEKIRCHVLQNDSIMAITTPYMRFYELEALCKLGGQKEVMNEIKSYWGGMLDEGATTFWEKYDPEEKGMEHLAMYGRPYGKSLCHAWGASPIYLLGKYFLGVKPLKAGYEVYEVAPCLGGLNWIKGTVPTPHGSIYVYMDKKKICIRSNGGKGFLLLPNQSKEKMVEILPNKELNLEYNNEN